MASEKTSLIVYVAGTAVVWAAILLGMNIWAKPRFHDFSLICGGFFIGMLAMYIAVHLYRWK